MWEDFIAYMGSLSEGEFRAFVAIALAAIFFWR